MTDTPKIERCPWPGITDPIYARYHDEEWGVPLTDDRLLFEKMILEGFQSGPVVADHPEEAREFPPRISQLRCRKNCPLRRSATLTA